jgi:hypothetical protein
MHRCYRDLFPFERHPNEGPPPPIATRHVDAMDAVVGNNNKRVPVPQEVKVDN